MRQFVKETAMKVVYTMAEAALGIIGGSQLLSEVNWSLVLSASVLAGIATILKCIVIDYKKIKGATELTDEEVEGVE